MFTPTICRCFFSVWGGYILLLSSVRLLELQAIQSDLRGEQKMVRQYLCSVVFGIRYPASGIEHGTLAFTHAETHGGKFRGYVAQCCIIWNSDKIGA